MHGGESFREPVRGTDGQLLRRLVADRSETVRREPGPVLEGELGRLPERLLRPVLLCYLEGKSTEEAAEDL